MKVQSQILQFKGKSGPKPGFLVIEVLISLLFCFTFIMVLLRFHGDILLLYERFFVRNIALDLAVNTLERTTNTSMASVDNEIVYGGRSLKLTAGVNRDYGDDASKKSSRSQVVVVWQNSAGRNEKLAIGSA